MKEILAGAITLKGPASWSIRGIAGGFTVVWGTEGSYKTFLAIGMGVCVAAGKPWLGAKVRQGPVLYILGEGGLGLFRRRAGEAAKAFKIDLAKVPLWVRGEALDLSSPNKLELYYMDWDKIAPNLIIVDTLSRCMPGDENSQEAMQGFVASMDTLRDRYGATVLVLHHATKTGAAIRGSSVLSGAIDVELHVRKAKDAAGKRIMLIQPRKLRDLDTEDFGHSRLFADVSDIMTGPKEWLLDDFGDKVSTVVLKEHPDYLDAVEQVYAVFVTLKSGRPKGKAVGFREWLMESKGMKKATFKRAINTILQDESKDVSLIERGQYTWTSELQGNPLATFWSDGDNWNMLEE